MQVVDPRMGKAVKPFRFAVGVNAGEFNTISLKQADYSQRCAGDTGYDGGGCIRSSKV